MAVNFLNSPELQKPLIQFAINPCSREFVIILIDFVKMCQDIRDNVPRVNIVTSGEGYCLHHRMKGHTVDHALNALQWIFRCDFLFHRSVYSISCEVDSCVAIYGWWTGELRCVIRKSEINKKKAKNDIKYWYCRFFHIRHWYVIVKDKEDKDTYQSN